MGSYYAKKNMNELISLFVHVLSILTLESNITHSRLIKITF